MKLFKLFAGVVFLFLAGHLQAQNKELLDKYSILKGDVIRLGAEVATKDISGSPYFEKDFKNGFIYFQDYPPLATELRYDVVNEEMQVLLEGQIVYQVLKDDVDVEISKISFKKLNYLSADGSKLYGYFEVITPEPADKPLILLQKYFKEIKTGTRAEARGFPPKYVDKSAFFLKFQNSKFAIPVENRLKSFISHFPAESRDAMESYIETNNLKLRKAEDLQQIVTHYNESIL